MSIVDSILEERASTHGDYSIIVEARGKILDELIGVYSANNGGENPDPKLIVMWCDLLLKIVRSAANPKHRDSWDDLEGYAKIIRKYITSHML